MAHLVVPIFGNMQDGDATVTTSTDAPIDASFSGTAGTTTGSGTNASFAAGQVVLIHQTRGTGATQWERNIIIGYSAGTITFGKPLDYTYTAGAQILVLKQYRNYSLSGGNTLTAKAWGGSVGGILSFIADRVTIAGDISAIGKGFRGSTQATSGGNPAGQGEGTGGDRNTQLNIPNGNGGGGAAVGTNKSGGGGGGNGTAGSAGGTAGGAPGTPGQGGNSVGDTALNAISLGGGGGGGDYDGSGGDRYYGNAGGGIVLIFARTLTISGHIYADGETATGSGGTNVGGGGGGAGGSVLLITQNVTLGSGLVTALGSSGRTGVGTNNANGGAGANGRIAIAKCIASGTTNPTYTDRGYQTYCGRIAGR